ncbi:MAG: phosphoadenylyl-sulfate reductase, partial [Micrococcaceae bacterium]|nr:phosphoadenylyl-sulfate reductase [Micrococcaceae bacterium]MDN5904993.1 phosphoadenylyl-sulfate reductase [Micrococcaceae bacterium]
MSGPSTGTAALRELASSGAAELGFDAASEDVLAWVARHFSTAEAAVACSMADAVLPHLVSGTLPGIDVLFLDTGYHFAQTLDTRDEVARSLEVNVVDVRPEQGVADQDATEGRDLFATDPGRCCALRKVDPLNRALAGYRLWFTGVRRDEAPTRTNTPLVDFDEAHSLVKVNPLAGWSAKELNDYSTRNRLPRNVLLDQGYPSIGCRPCTGKVAPGEDPRAGRWSGQTKTECGI